MDGAIHSVSLATDVEAAQAEPNAATIATSAKASARRNQFNEFQRNRDAMVCPLATVVRLTEAEHCAGPHLIASRNNPASSTGPILSIEARKISTLGNYSGFNRGNT